MYIKNKIVISLVVAFCTSCVAPISNKGLSGSLSDSQINSVISAKLHAKSSKAFAQIDIDVHMGDVLLTGFIDDVDIGVEAEKIAWKTSGVKAVYNHIQNNPESTLIDYTKDAWITAKIKSQLATKKNIKSFNYLVKTVAGNVYILGVAESEEELTLAHDIAQKTAGAKKITSYVKLKENVY